MIRQSGSCGSVFEIWFYRFADFIRRESSIYSTCQVATKWEIRVKAWHESGWTPKGPLGASAGLRECRVAPVYGRSQLHYGPVDGGGSLDGRFRRRNF